MNLISGFIAVLLLALAASLYALGLGIVLPIVCVLLAVIVLAALQLASQWDRVVILRAGKFNRTVGPGVFLMLPIIDSVAAWIDTRTRSIVFKAEDTLTSDTVPVNVDAVLFLTVTDPEKAALQVTDYLGSISLAAQTALRDSISSTDLRTLLIDRTDLDAHLKEAIGQKTADWGVSVDSVELRDVKVPVALQDAMSREAQAEREKRARVLLGTAELAIAQSFVDAATTYGENKTALALRAMNITYEVAKAGSVVIMPSGSIGSTDIAQIAALTTSIGHNDTGPRQ